MNSVTGTSQIVVNNVTHSQLPRKGQGNAKNTFTAKMRKKSNRFRPSRSQYFSIKTTDY